LLRAARYASSSGRHDLGEDGRVVGVEDLSHARQVDLLLERLVENVSPAHPRRRVGVELEELEVVVVKERVEPGDADRLRKAGVDPHERVFLRRELQLVAKPRVVAVGIAEAIEQRRDRGNGIRQPAQLPGRYEVGHDHERDRPRAVDEPVVHEPVLDLGLHHRATITELRELDQVLKLEVTDLVDHSR
jgi:hypothetical protein